MFASFSAKEKQNKRKTKSQEFVHTMCYSSLLIRSYHHHLNIVPMCSFKELTQTVPVVMMMATAVLHHPV